MTLDSPVSTPRAPSRPHEGIAAPESPTELAAAFRYFLRFPSPRIVTTCAVVATIARVVVGGWSWLDLAVAGAIVLVWPLQEWLIHVFILHYKPVTLFGRTWDFPTPISHRVHHRDPWNLPILFIPTHVFWYALPAQVVLWFWLAPNAGVALTGLTTFFILTCNYEWTHYLVHTRVKPKSRYYERLWRNHRLHHCKNEHYWFGVSRLGGDRLLGTAPELGEVATSRTCRTLGLEEVISGAN